jgi:vacuolar protein sorting-associated protein 1
VLCVIPANQDLAISDGLKLAREWDKDGSRTIGVITKIDIMDKGTSAKRMLMNEEIHLKLGYIGIVNRAQEDIINRVPVEVALKREIEFFNKHPDYRDLPERYLGTRSLTTKLSEQLVEAIKRSLPEVMRQIEEKLDELNGEQEAMGTPPPASSREKSNFLMQLIADFSNNYKNTLSGKYVANAKVVSSEEIGKGAIIKGKFKDIFLEFPKSHKCSADYDDEFIKNTLKSHQGDEISGFPSMECFRSLLVPQLAKLKDPAYSTLDFIYMELVELAGELNGKVFSRFPDLLALVNDITNKKLSDLKAQTEVILDTLIEGEMNTVFTNDAKYLSARDELLAVSYFLHRKQLLRKTTPRSCSSVRSRSVWTPTST